MSQTPTQTSSQMPSHASKRVTEGEDAPPGQAQYPRVRTAEEVFVSPRVVDRVAFEDYAGALRKLLAAATTEGEHLRRTAVDASRSLRAIGEVLPAVDKKLAKAGEMLSTLTQRLESAEATAKRAEAAAERAVTAEQRIKDMDDRARQRIFEAGNAAMDEAVGRIEEVAEKRAKELDDRGETLTTFVDRGRADLAEARSKAVEALHKAAEQTRSDADAGLRAIKDQASEARERIAEDHANASHAVGQARNESVEAIAAERREAEAAMSERIATLSARLQELVEQAERRLTGVFEERDEQLTEQAVAVSERVEATTSRMDEMLEEAQKRLTGVIESGDTKAGERVEALGKRIAEEVEPKLAEAEANADAVLDRIEKVDTRARGVFELDLDGVEALCERAEKLLQQTGAGQAKPDEGTLAAVAAQAMAAMEQMDDVATAGERARRQAEESRKALSESIESAGLWLDRLVEQRDGLQQSISLATKLCEQAEAQLTQRRAELDEAMRAPATEVKRHLDTLKAASEEAEAKRAALAELIEESEKRAEKKANAAADKAAEKAIHKAKIESEKLDAKAMQARQALDQAWKTLETRLKGELKESLTALSAEAQRAERARQSLREDIEAARQVEKETRAAISKPAAPSSVDQLNKLATLMQDLAERTAGKKPAAVAVEKPASELTPSAAATTPAEAPVKKAAKKTAKKTARKTTTTKATTEKATTKKAASKKTATKKTGG
ncbi:hypothetical protein AY599_17090 [Leptolyngbya valderiana BDU 20041]|nr:hypothetical protein AY599_17090 [Leptolyngbya valderiana BDU 20041]